MFTGVDLSNIEQNGWVYFNYGWCVAVLPQKGIREHVIREDTECWCDPKEEPIYGGDPSLLISHNEKEQSNE